MGQIFGHQVEVLVVLAEHKNAAARKAVVVVEADLRHDQGGYRHEYRERTDGAAVCGIRPER